MGMPNEDLQGDWNVVSSSSDALGRCTAALERHLLGRNRGNIDLFNAQHRNQRCPEGILGSGEIKEYFRNYFYWNIIRAYTTPALRCLFSIQI